ncbi:MAG: class I SAM-dependent methyltransferase [Actinomycetes bacterium]
MRSGSRAWRADVRRTVGLARAFRHAQDDPDRFYSELAADAVAQVAVYADLGGALVADIGGGPGYYRTEFLARGARYLVVDPDLRELSARGTVPPDVVIGDGMRLPVRSASVDVAFSSNALEHVPDPVRFADEMVRVTRPGGLIFLSYTNWLSPNGGHETGPYHLVVGGRLAAERYARRNGHRPKNDLGRTLFRLSAAKMLTWANTRECEGAVAVVDRRPRYHPQWARWVINVPGVREVATWNVLLVLRRPT